MYIYSLIDPITDEIRYIGKTRARSYSHLVSIGRLRKCNNEWILNLLEKGLRPKIEIIGKHDPKRKLTLKQIKQHCLSNGHRIFDDLGFKIKSTQYNHKLNYFEKIDTEEKAYLLGFIAADGNVWPNPRNNNWQLTIQLQQKDLELLEKIKKCLGYTGPIYTSYKDQKPYSMLKISSRRLCEDLVSLGVTPQKTYSISAPQIDKELIRHFLRGYYDADGSIILRSTKAYVILVSGSLNFLKWVKSILDQITKARPAIYLEGKRTWRLDYGSYLHVKNNSTMCILDYLYKDSHIHLERKYELYLDCKKIDPSQHKTYKQLKQDQFGHKIQRVEDGKIYLSISEAARDVGSRVSNIQAALRSPQRTCKGFHWKYASHNPSTTNDEG